MKVVDDDDDVISDVESADCRISVREFDSQYRTLSVCMLGHLLYLQTFKKSIIYFAPWFLA